MCQEIGHWIAVLGRTARDLTYILRTAISNRGFIAALCCPLSLAFIEDNEATTKRDLIRGNIGVTPKMVATDNC